MHWRTEMIVTFLGHDLNEVRFREADTPEFIGLEQGGLLIVIPKKELSEFCRKLQEWAAENG